MEIKSINLTEKEKKYKNTNYTRAEVATNDIIIGPKKTEQIYLTFKVKSESINKLLNEDLNINNVIEISKYSITDSNQNTYAGIDKDSAPRNVIPGEKSTYEDDTDQAPALNIKKGNEKKISGTVFEDSTDPNLKTGKERIGNGKYDSNDNGQVQGVRVELVNLDTNRVAKIYPDAINAKDATYITNKNGYYEINGLIPGKYVLKYTYGDGTAIYSNSILKNAATTQDYKSTIITSQNIQRYLKGSVINNYWYLDNDVINNKYSVATDDYYTRKNINEHFSTIDYNKQTQYNNEEKQYKSITANTPNLQIEIEDKKYPNGSEYGKNFIYNYENINFGISERPRTSINVTKEISHIKLTLANGQVLIDGDPRNETLNHIVYPKEGMLKIELDNEILQGSKLDVTYSIKVDNKSELDYNTENYYKYGTNKIDLVTLSVNKMVEYLDEKLVTDKYEEYKEGYTKEYTWYQINPSNIKDTISEKAYNKVKNKSKTYLTCGSFPNITPGNCKTIEFSASKLLTTSSGDDDLTFENHVEVIEYSNSVGRFYETYNVSNTTQRIKATPGNYVLNEGPIETDSNSNYNNATITITPPTGKNKLYLILIIGTISLIVLATGVIVIKKKVL